MLKTHLKLAVSFAVMAILTAHPAHARPHNDLCLSQALENCEYLEGSLDWQQCTSNYYVTCVNENPDLFPNGMNSTIFGPNFYDIIRNCTGRIDCGW